MTTSQIIPSMPLKNPVQCVLWNKKEIDLLDLDLELVNVFVRNPHVRRDLFKCRECGQLYFHEWYEHMVFKHDAYMYDTYIPVETEEQIQTLLKTKNTGELAQYMPQIHGSHTNGLDDPLRWITNKHET